MGVGDRLDGGLAQAGGNHPLSIPPGGCRVLGLEGGGKSKYLQVPLVQMVRRLSYSKGKPTAASNNVALDIRIFNFTQ